MAREFPTDRIIYDTVPFFLRQPSAFKDMTLIRSDIGSEQEEDLEQSVPTVDVFIPSRTDGKLHITVTLDVAGQLAEAREALLKA